MHATKTVARPDPKAGIAFRFNGPRGHVLFRPPISESGSPRLVKGLPGAGEVGKLTLFNALLLRGRGLAVALLSTSGEKPSSSCAQPVSLLHDSIDDLVWPRGVEAAAKCDPPKPRTRTAENIMNLWLIKTLSSVSLLTLLLLSSSIL